MTKFSFDMSEQFRFCRVALGRPVETRLSHADQDIAKLKENRFFGPYSLNDEITG
jgi:hypothetical protein